MTAQTSQTQTQKYEVERIHMHNHVKGLVVTELSGTATIMGKIENKETAKSIIYNYIMYKLWEIGHSDAKVDIHIKRLTVLDESKKPLTLVEFNGTVIIHAMTVGGGANSIFVISELKLSQ